MKRFLSSLAGRLVVWVVIAQALVSVPALVASLVIWQGPEDRYFFAQMNLSRIAAAAVTPADGGLVLRETPDLRAYRAARPGVRIAVLSARGALPGSSPDLAQALKPFGYPTIASVIMTLSDGPLAGSTLVVTPLTTSHGELVLAATDNPLRMDDVPALAAYMLGYLARVMGVVLLAGAIVTPLVIAAALRPLQAASREAARIDLKARSLRLPQGEGVPSELLPLVRSINGALARLEEGFERQQRYAAQAAHELRTPLAILAARIDADGPASEGLRRDVERMRRLVDQFLLATRLERGDVTLDQQVDLVALARNVVADCSPLALAEGRDLALSPKLDRLVVAGNRGALESALVNLIQNAIQVEPVGGTIEVLVREPAEVLVIDHGPGIAAGLRDQVFEPFWRGDERRPGGGLGLAIAREAAAAHGGGVQVCDTPGGGATFRFWIGT